MTANTIVRSHALLLKLREAPEPSVRVDPPLQIATETWDDDSPNEPNFDADPGKNPTCNEQVPDTTPNASHLETNPISPRGTGTFACYVGTPADARKSRNHRTVTRPVTRHRTAHTGRSGAPSYPRDDHSPATNPLFKEATCVSSRSGVLLFSELNNNSAGGYVRDRTDSRFLVRERAACPSSWVRPRSLRWKRSPASSTSPRKSSVLPCASRKSSPAVT